MEYSTCPTRKMQLFASAGCVEGLSTFFTWQAQFYNPEVRGKVSGEMQFKGCAILTCCAERSVHRSAGIDHHQVARVEKRPNLPELRVNYLRSETGGLSLHLDSTATRHIFADVP